MASGYATASRIEGEAMIEYIIEYIAEMTEGFYETLPEDFKVYVDANRLVRCKDCIYYSDGECKSGTLPYSEFSDLAHVWLMPYPNDYCSRGERRSDATN